MNEFQEILMDFLKVLEGNKSQTEQAKSSIDALTRRLEFIDSNLTDIKHTLNNMAKVEAERQSLFAGFVKSPAFTTIITAIIAVILSILGIRYTGIQAVATPAAYEAPK